MSHVIDLVSFMMIDTGDSEVKSLACTPDGLRLFSGSSDFNISLWNTTNGELIRKISSKFHMIYDTCRFIDLLFKVNKQKCPKLMFTYSSKCLCCTTGI